MSLWLSIKLHEELLYQFALTVTGHAGVQQLAQLSQTEFYVHSTTTTTTPLF